MPVFSAYWAFDFLLEIVEFAYENKTTKDLFIASARVGEGNRESALHMLARSLNYSEKEKETSGEWNMPYRLMVFGAFHRNLCKKFHKSKFYISLKFLTNRKYISLKCLWKW